MNCVSLNRRINEHYFRQIQTSDLGAVLLQDLTREALREGLLFYLLLHLEWNCLDATNMSTWQPQPVHAFRLSLFPVSYACCLAVPPRHQPKHCMLYRHQVLTTKVQQKHTKGTKALSRNGNVWDHPATRPTRTGRRQGWGAPQEQEIHVKAFFSGFYRTYSWS